MNKAGVGFFSINKVISAGIDPDAQAFLTAANITDNTISSSINTLVLGLKSNNLWSKSLAIYPYVGATQSSCSYNLKDPRNLNAAYRLSFSAGFSYAPEGVSMNSTGFYSANTFMNFKTLGFTQLTLAMYINSSFVSSCYDSGVFQSGVGDVALLAGCGSTTFYFGASQFVTNTETTDTGFYLGTNDGSTSSLYKNGSLRKSQASGFNMPNYNFTLFSNNVNGVSGNDPSRRRQAFYLISNQHFSSTDASNLNTLVQTFQTSLGRAV